MFSNSMPIGPDPAPGSYYKWKSPAAIDYGSLEKTCSKAGLPSKRTVDPIVTGTSVLAIKYKDGVLVAADTLGSYGSLARFRDISRVKAVGKDTLVGVGGDLSDYQALSVILDDIVINDYCVDDGSTLTPKEIYSYLTRVLYERRNKMDPLWNQVVVAGFRNGQSFLGLTDLYGTSYEDGTIATGYGAYIAIPLMREAYRDGTLTEEEARKLLEDCLRVLYYRDARSINRVQIAKVDATGVTISAPFELETQWTIGESGPICYEP